MRCHSKTVWVAIYLLAAIVAPCTADSANTSKRAHFYFVQITDTHFGEKDAVARAERVVAAINQLPLPIECIVHTGDITMDRMTDAATIEESLRVMRALKAPVHYAAGNHDIKGGEQLLAMAESFQKNIGPLASKAEYQGVVFLTVCTEPLGTSWSIAGYDPLAWLKQALKEAGNKPVIIFQHRVLLDDFYGGKFHPFPNEAVQHQWEKLVTARNVKAVISGHFHRDELHWLGKTPVYVSAPVSGLFGRQASFRVYEYDNGKVGYWCRYIE